MSLFALAGRGSDTTSTPSSTTAAMGGKDGHGILAPLVTSENDWKPVADALGRAGTLNAEKTVYRMPLPRRDLSVVTQDVPIKPGLSLGGYAAFAKYDDGVMLMGDLVVTEPELQPVINALQAHGIAQTGVHKHLLEQTPPVWWTQMHAMGDGGQIAQGIRAALDATATAPPAPPSGPQPPIDLDTAAIDTALGHQGTADGGIYKFTLGRADIVTDDNHILPAGLGVTTGINFQPLGGGKAAINGDFVMTQGEVQNVLKAQRAGGISIVELHNHGLTEQPRLFYTHFWAVGAAAAPRPGAAPGTGRHRPRARQVSSGQPTGR